MESSKQLTSKICSTKGKLNRIDDILSIIKRGYLLLIFMTISSTLFLIATNTKYLIVKLPYGLLDLRLFYIFIGFINIVCFSTWILWLVLAYRKTKLM